MAIIKYPTVRAQSAVKMLLEKMDSRMLRSVVNFIGDIDIELLLSSTSDYNKREQLCLDIIKNLSKYEIEELQYLTKEIVSVCKVQLSDYIPV